MRHAQWAVEIRSVDAGGRLYSLHADKLMMPASNMKILTVATAAEVLGWDARMTTTLESAAEIVDGELRGDLIVRGSGDPTINARDGRAAAVFDAWAEALRAAGIRAIRGRVVGDDQAFDDEGLGGGWAWDYLQYGYAAPVGALQYNENVAELVVAPAAVPGEPAIVRLGPGTGLELISKAATGPAGAEQTVDYRRHLHRPVLEVFGIIPLGAKPATRSVAVVNPTVHFVQAAKDALAARGIEISGEAVDLDDIAAGMPVEREPAVLASTDSPAVSEIATVLMKVSQNAYAETLLKAAGRARGGLGTTAAGRLAAQATLAAWGIPEESYVMADGSGLSRYNYVTAAAVADVLERLYRDPRHRERFLATLPVAGKDGTLAARMRRSRAEGNALAKTGSISNVRALSGFVRTRDGEVIVFSILANDFILPAATVTWIADLAVEVLANFTRHPQKAGAAARAARVGREAVQ